MPWRRIKGKTHIFLLAIIGLLVLYPHLERSGHGQVMMSFLVAMVMVAGVYAVSSSRRMFIWALILSVPTLLSGLLLGSGRESFGMPVITSLQLAFFAFTLVRMLIYVLKPSRVTPDKLSAAICVYLLLGVCWSFWYQLQETLRPGSFQLASAEGYLQIPHRSDLLFFSFVTLTTLGYGDITPVSSYARTATILEAVTGVLFVAILIARLVSMYRQEPDERKV